MKIKFLIHTRIYRYIYLIRVNKFIPFHMNDWNRLFRHPEPQRTSIVPSLWITPPMQLGFYSVQSSLLITCLDFVGENIRTPVYGTPSSGSFSESQFRKLFILGIDLEPALGNYYTCRDAGVFVAPSWQLVYRSSVVFCHTHRITVNTPTHR